MLFRLVDETLLEQDMAAQFPTEIVDVCPYPSETSVPSVQLLEEDDSFYAGRPLMDAETNNVSDILAIGDSMFHKVRFYGRLRQEACKVSFGGGRIPEMKIYMQESGRRKSKVVILCMGHNDILKRKKRGKNISLGHILKLYVASIDWYKLHQLEVPLAIQRRIANFLRNRKIYVQWNHCISEPFKPSAGVPQGSVISPILFNIYVAKPNHGNAQISQFADDTALY